MKFGLRGLIVPIRWIYRLLIGNGLLLLPFQVWQGVFPSETGGKILFAGWILLVIIAAGGILLVIKGRLKLSVTPIDGLCILYGIYFLIRLMLMYPAIPDRLKITAYLVPVFLYFIFRTLDLRGLFILGIFMVLAAVGQSVYGILQVSGVFNSLHPQFNITGSFFNPGPYGGYIACMLPVLLGKYYLTSRKFVKIVCLAGFTIILVALVLSKSRAAWLGGLAGILYILWKQHRAWLRNTFSHIHGIIRLIVAIILLCFVMAGGISLYTMKKPSADGRLLIWRNTCELIADHPLLGTGPGHFKAHYMNYQARYFERTLPDTINEPADNTVYAFNEFLELAAEQGMIGLLLFLVLLGSVFTIKGSDLWLTCLARAGLLCILVFACFSYPFDILPIKIQIAFFLATAAYNQRPLMVVYLGRVSVIACFLVICLSLYPAGKYIHATAKTHADWKQTFDGYSQKSPERSLQLAASIAPSLQNNGLFQGMYGHLLSLSGQPEQAIDVLKQAIRQQPDSRVWMDLGDNYKKLGNCLLAEEAYQKAWLMIPSRIMPRCKLARLYYDMGRMEEAKTLIEETLQHWSTRKHTRDSYAVVVEMEGILMEIDHTR